MAKCLGHEEIIFYFPTTWLLLHQEGRAKEHIPQSPETRPQDSHWIHETGCPIINSMQRFPEACCNIVSIKTPAIKHRDNEFLKFTPHFVIYHAEIQPDGSCQIPSSLLPVRFLHQSAKKQGNSWATCYNRRIPATYVIEKITNEKVQRVTK